MASSAEVLDQRLHHAEILLNISRRVAAKETLDEVLKTLVEITTTEIGAERGSLFLNDGAPANSIHVSCRATTSAKSGFSTIQA